jgi:shikimate kinase
MSGDTMPSSTARKLQSGNFFLIGMMGCGKTTIGKLLAKRRGKRFIDSDEIIQQRTGVSITHIFDIEGEAGFRQRESGVIQELSGSNNIVLATGGGAILNEQNRAALRENGIVIYLKSSVHDLWLRTRNDRSRPLLQTANPREKLAVLHEQRDPLYAQAADVTVLTGKQGASILMEQLERRVDEFLHGRGDE